jgi:aminoglycoside phosphotransferase (APT) family kinase protein
MIGRVHVTFTDTSWSPVPGRTDIGQTRAALAAWLRQRRPDWSDLEITSLRPPTTTGGTGDNLLVTIVCRPDGQPAEHRLVVRLAPADFITVHGADIAQHFAVLEALWPTAVPSPEPLWLETDETVLGLPYMVMSQVPGQAPSDFPIYNQSGFLAEAPAGYRRRAWRSAVEALAASATVDRSGFSFLDRPDRGPTGLDQHLSYIEEAFAAAHDGSGHPGIERGLEWIRANRPGRTVEGLSWGDARLGNVLIGDDGRVTALLDWDRASLGGPLVDLGWWLLFDRMHAEDYGYPRLEGLGRPEETIALWSDLTGIDAGDAGYYEILGAAHLAVIRLRSIRMRSEHGLWVPDAGNPRGVDRLLERMNRMIARYEAW